MLYEDNFFETAFENSKGYSITVLSSKIVTTEQFLMNNDISQLDIPDENAPAIMRYIPDFIVDVEVKIRNIDNKDSGVDMYNTVLIADTYKLQVNDTIWNALYPNLSGSFKFALIEGTEETIHLPYAISYSDAIERKAVTNNMLTESNFQLIVTKYPVDIRINIGKVSNENS